MSFDEQVAQQLYDKLHEAITQKKHTIFIVNVDGILGTTWLNNSLAAISHPNITLVIASQRSIDFLRKRFPQHTNFIANTGAFVQIMSNIANYDKPDYSLIKPQLDALAVEINIKPVLDDDYYLRLPIPPNHHDFDSAFERATKLVAEINCQLTVTKTMKDIKIGPSNPDGMWTGIQNALGMIGGVTLANFTHDSFNQNTFIVYFGDANHDDVVAMRRIKTYGGLSIAALKGVHGALNYASYTFADPMILQTICQQIAGSLSK